MKQEVLDLLDVVQELQGKEAIRNLITTYCQSVDSYEKNSFLSIWDENAIYQIPRGEAKGKAEIAKLFDQIAAAEQNHHHHVTNSKIEVNVDSARSTSDILYYRLIAGESTVLSGRYYDEFIKRSGRWYLKRREFKPQVTVSPVFIND